MRVFKQGSVCESWGKKVRRMFNLHIQRLNRLPLQRLAVWQGGVMPVGMFNGEDIPDPIAAFKVSPYQGPYVGYWLSLQSAHSYTSNPEAPHVDPCIAALNALVQFACDTEIAGYRPGKIVVSNKNIAQYLQPLLIDAEIEVELADEMHIAPRDFIYLGDTNTDMQTARAAGMYALGATWGFRPGAELLDSGAQHLLETPQQLLDHL